MTNYSISFKIDDYNPKIDFISYTNFKCLLIYEDFQLKISLTDNDYKNPKHLLKNIKSDLYYKITIFDDKIKTLIGVNDFIIPYKLLYKINPNESFTYKKEIRFMISQKSKNLLFSSINKIENMLIKLSAKIYKKQKLRKSSKKSDSINNNYLSPPITERTSFIQKNNKNLIKDKVVINKNKINKNKDEFLYSESNKLISTNDLSGNFFNTYSNIDDNDNNNITNNYINNISTINNIINQNYYCIDTNSRNDELKNNINNTNNLYINKNKDCYNNSEGKGKEVLGIRNKLKKRFHFNNGIINNMIINDKKEKKKYSVRNSKKKKSNNKALNKSKTRNIFNSYIKNKNGNILGSEDESNSSSLNRNRIIKFTNEDKKFNSCESYYIKQYMKTEAKKIKTKSIIRSFIDKNMKYQNKFISLSKDKYEKLLNKKKKYLTENILYKGIMPESLNMSQNIKEKNEIRIKRNVKSKKNKNDNSQNKNSNNNIINKVNNKINIKNINNNRCNKDILHNNFQIKVRKAKNKNNINIEKNNNYENEQLEIKKYDIKLSQYFILNNKNIRSIYLKLKENQKKLFYTKELFFSLLKKSNRLEEEKSFLFINKLLLNTNNSCLYKIIKKALRKEKRKEFRIFQKIFNLSDFSNEVPNYRENEKIIEQKIFKLQLCIINNLIKHYGNISHIFFDDISKKEKLKSILIKNNIIEKENKNSFIDLVSLDKINTSVKKIIKSTFNNEVNYNYNIIKEVQEEKESEKNSNTINSANNISSLNNDISDEILFIDKKESYCNEENPIFHIPIIKNTSNTNNFKNDYSNSLPKNNLKKECRNDINIKKNIRKELIGMDKKKFKGKELNFEEFGIDSYAQNKGLKKDNFFKIGFFNKKKKD